MESSNLALPPSSAGQTPIQERKRRRSFICETKPDLSKIQSTHAEMYPLQRANEANSGILEKHLEAIKKICHDQKIFLLIRPTESASTRLIKYGYETKSLDIHSKSANGGLAKGFIPVDAAFSKNGKKLQLQPSPDLDILQENLKLHGKAKITTLFMPDELLNEYAEDNEITEIFLTQKSRINGFLPLKIIAQQISFIWQSVLSLIIKTKTLKITMNGKFFGFKNRVIQQILQLF